MSDRPERAAAEPAADPAPAGVWSAGRRRLTSGLVLTITLVAFESLAIATIMPTVSDDLGDLALYGWVFSGFFLGSLLGIVLAGQAADERGTRLPYAIGLALFAAGLVVGGAAQSMPMLVAGRVAQGVGAGAIPAVAYAAVGGSSPAELRPRVFAIFSTAWVVPGLIGPVAATSLAEVLSWRAVFWALIPLVGLAAAMTIPALGVRHADAAAPDADATDAGGRIEVATAVAAELEARIGADAIGAAPADPAAVGRAPGLDVALGPSAPPEVRFVALGSDAGRPPAVTDGPLGVHQAVGTPPPARGAAASDNGDKVRATAPADLTTGLDLATGPPAPAGGAAADEPGGVAVAVERQAVSLGIDPRLGALVLVLGVALVLGGLGAGSPLIGAPLVVVGAVPAAWAFLRLVPAGTVGLAPGMPAAVAVRGILTFAFFGTDAYVSLAVTDARHQSTWLAGAALTAATLCWTSGSWLQERIVQRRGPRWLVRRGFACLIVANVGMLLFLRPVPAVLILLIWGLGGLSMGISYSSISLTVLGLAEPGHEGVASSALQLSDVLGVSLGTGLVGVFVALGEGRGWATGSSLTLGFVMTLVVSVGGLLAARRIPECLPD
jgi:MFS family permease